MRHVIPCWRVAIVFAESCSSRIGMPPKLGYAIDRDRCACWRLRVLGGKGCIVAAGHFASVGSTTAQEINACDGRVFAAGVGEYDQLVERMDAAALAIVQKQGELIIGSVWRDRALDQCEISYGLAFGNFIHRFAVLFVLDCRRAWLIGPGSR